MPNSESQMQMACDGHFHYPFSVLRGLPSTPAQHPNCISIAAQCVPARLQLVGSPTAAGMHTDATLEHSLAALPKADMCIACEPEIPLPVTHPPEKWFLCARKRCAQDPQTRNYQIILPKLKGK